jgi:glutathione S-transferase
MTEYTLYCFHISGHAYKVALMLNLCGAKWKPRWVDFRGGETRTPEYREKVNEQGEAPVLEWDGNKRLSQSAVILEYLSEQFGKFRWNNDDERREVFRWLFWDNHRLTSYTATWRYFVSVQKTPDHPAAEVFRARATAAMDILNKHLAAKKFVIGDRPTIADISMCGYLYWPEEFGVNWERDYPNIGRWLNDIKALPGWKHPYELMPDRPV